MSARSSGETRLQAALLDSQRRVLEAIGAGAPLDQVCDMIVRLVEAQAAGMRCAVLEVEPGGNRLRFVAAPNIPLDYRRNAEPFLDIAEKGSCGAAALLRRPVYTRDTSTDPLWEGVGEIAARNGLYAIWSTPILGAGSEVLGTFAMYYGEPRLPSSEHIVLIDMATQLARVAIETRRLGERLHTLTQGVDERLRVAIDILPALVAIHGADGTTLFANARSREYFGFDRAQPPPDSLRRLVHRDDRERYIADWYAGIASGAAFEIEGRLRRSDGEYRWVLGRATPLRTPGGEILEWYAAGVDIEDRKRAEQALAALKDRLSRENQALKQEIEQRFMYGEIVGISPALERVLSLVERIAPADSAVLIQGETGSGKELVARAIHKRSPRAGAPFVTVNCAATPPARLAADLFGDDGERRSGRLELAQGGTLFLDEIGEMPAPTQLALLRVLETRAFERVGGSTAVAADVRIIAASNRDLGAAVKAGQFRDDLFYRLNVLAITLPPLRERVEDIPLLVRHFADRHAARLGKHFESICEDSMALMQSYRWPGNVRELQNLVERAVVLSTGGQLKIEQSWLQADGERPSGALMAALANRERELIEAALAQAQGRVAGRLGAAAILGVPRTTLESKIRSLGIDKHRFKARAVTT